MKYILIIWVCSFIGGERCMPPIQSDKLYNSWYECSRAAHKESLKILQKSGYANVNRYKFGIKYNCKVATTT
tara:strand:- start:288 stop:503 length:216 start_codon:yes stop_codon:yes gene_type:complete